METQGSPGSRVDPVDFVKNVAFNIVKDKTTSDLLKALSNIYENIDYEQGIFDAYIVQFIDVSNWIRL